MAVPTQHPEIRNEVWGSFIPTEHATTLIGRQSSNTFSFAGWLETQASRLVSIKDEHARLLEESQAMQAKNGTLEVR